MRPSIYMKPWILPVLMTAVATLLVVAVFSPEAVNEVVAVPKGWIETRRSDALKARTQRAWNDVGHRAANGDAAAMYRLGMKMRFPSDEEFSGIRLDPDSGMKMVRAAANAGHIAALIEVWKTGDRHAHELVRIAEEALDRSNDPANLKGLSDWLQWTAIQTCDGDAQDAAERILGRVTEFGHADARDKKRFEAFADTYERRCNAS